MSVSPASPCDSVSLQCGMEPFGSEHTTLVHNSARFVREAAATSPILMLIADVLRKQAAQHQPHHIRACLNATDPKSAIFAYQITAAFGSDFTLSCTIV